MGRLYSGNLAAYKDAIERLKEDYDANVVVETYRYGGPRTDGVAPQDTQ
ncbi:dGTP triphosphohydrolase inhibitor [Edwardsiella phage PVN09]|uniref:dGTP triphosphohydrolase inhibitor n=1 Tax=Edwardsiella phage PVN09 TaxID=2859518 RepID=A0AAE7VKE2_9CAUD|nr:dGTP triphosphohydrolase inhibitor [Edwardsiella phage PVN09]